jgi:outer membrane biosynthesis protein TonB
VSPLAGVRRRWAVSLLAGVLALAACGQQSPPAAAVPELADLQAQVAQAVQDEDWEAARTVLDDLVAVAEAAGASGALPPAQVDDVVTAAEGLAVTLPEPEPEPEPEPSPSPTPEPAPAPAEEEPQDAGGDDGSDGGEDEGDDDKDGDKGKGKGKDDD